MTPPKLSQPGLSQRWAHPGGKLPPRLQPRGRWGPVKSWVLWVLAFTGIYASSSVCPFCGAAGCPVGIGGAALVGGLFATLGQMGRKFFPRLKAWWARREGTAPPGREPDAGS
jgi:hypothetical protein